MHQSAAAISGRRWQMARTVLYRQFAASTGVKRPSGAGDVRMKAVCCVALAAALSGIAAPVLAAQQPSTPPQTPQPAPPPEQKPEPKPEEPQKYEETVVVS